MTFGTFGKPVDPRYLRFEKGWEDYFNGEIGVLLVRWSPWEKGGGWFTYPRNKFDHVDVGLPAKPATPLRWSWDKRDDRMEWQAEFHFNAGPDLFAALDTAYASFKAPHPRAVWSPYDGSWRVVRWRGAPAPAPVPQPQPDPPTVPQPVPPGLRNRLNELYQLHADRLITDEQLKVRINELLAEYL